MKRLTALLLSTVIMAMGLASCQKSPLLRITTQNNLLFDCPGGNLFFMFSCDGDWSVSASESWIQVSEDSGTASSEDNILITVTCEPNYSAEPRSATITVKSAGLSEKVLVEQTAISIKTEDASYVGVSTAILQGNLQTKIDESKTLGFVYDDTESSLEGLIKNGLTCGGDGTAPFSGQVFNLKPQTTYYYASFIYFHKTETYVYGDVRTIQTGKDLNYGEAIDLGLSVNWRNCNLGATSPEERGNYYAWGEIEVKKPKLYTRESYKWFSGVVNNQYTYSKYVNGSDILEKEDDVAHVLLSGKWRMPTKGECYELIENCTWEKAAINDISGYKITSKINGNSIFLPNASVMNEFFRWPQERYAHYAQYWSSELSYSGAAYRIDTSSSATYPMSSSERHYGHVIRPVEDK